jgi:hypothetical protein
MATYMIGSEDAPQAQRASGGGNPLNNLAQLAALESRQRYYDYLMDAEARKDAQYERVKGDEREQFRLNLLQNVGIENLKKREAEAQFNGLNRLIESNKDRMTAIENSLANLGLPLDSAGILNKSAIESAKNDLFTKLNKQGDDKTEEKVALAEDLLNQLMTLQTAQQRLGASIAGIDGAQVDAISGTVIGFQYPTRLKDFYMNEFQLDPFTGQPLNRQQIPAAPDQEQVIEANEKVEEAKTTLTPEEAREVDSNALGAEVLKNSSERQQSEIAPAELDAYFNELVKFSGPRLVDPPARDEMPPQAAVGDSNYITPLPRVNPEDLGQLSNPTASPRIGERGYITPLPTAREEEFEYISTDEPLASPIAIPAGGFSLPEEPYTGSLGSEAFRDATPDQKARDNRKQMLAAEMEGARELGDFWEDRINVLENKELATNVLSYIDALAGGVGVGKALLKKFGWEAIKGLFKRGADDAVDLAVPPSARGRFMPTGQGLPPQPNINNLAISPSARGRAMPSYTSAADDVPLAVPPAMRGRGFAPQPDISRLAMPPAGRGRSMPTGQPQLDLSVPPALRQRGFQPQP